jgi:hypothetical protein
MTHTVRDLMFPMQTHLGVVVKRPFTSRRGQIYLATRPPVYKNTAGVQRDVTTGGHGHDAPPLP